MSPPAFTVLMMDARELKANPRNFRIHTLRQKKEISRSLREFGWLETVLYNSRTELLINGHARVEQAALKGEQVPVRIINVDPKTERRILASLQRTGDLGQNDEEQLARLLQEIAEESDELPVGWSGDELEKLFAELNAINEEQEAEDEEEEPGEAEDGLMPADISPSNLRTIQLLLTIESEPRFRRMVEALGAQWAVETLTQVVFSAVEMAYEAVFTSRGKNDADENRTQQTLQDER